MRTIDWTHRAEYKLRCLYQYIANDNVIAAKKTVRRIIISVDMLATQPALGRVGRIKDTRELILVDIPYIIAYRVTPNSIDILTIMHASQQWPEDL